MLELTKEARVSLSCDELSLSDLNVRLQDQKKLHQNCMLSFSIAKVEMISDHNIWNPSKVLDSAVTVIFIILSLFIILIL